MTKLQMANVAMLNTVQKVLFNNKTAWIGIKPIADEVEELNPLMDIITANVATQFQSQTGGYTNQKDVAMELMNKQGFTIGQRLASWARKNGNEVVFKAVSYSKSGLEKGTEQEQISRNTAIATVGTNNLSKVGDYKVNAENLATFQTAIASAKSLVIVRDAMGGARQVATESIETTVQKALAIVTNIDLLIESMLEEEDNVLEETYFAARKVTYHRGGVAKADAPNTL